MKLVKIDINLGNDEELSIPWRKGKRSDCVERNISWLVGPFFHRYTQSDFLSESYNLMMERCNLESMVFLSSRKREWKVRYTSLQSKKESIFTFLWPQDLTSSRINPYILCLKTWTRGHPIDCHATHSVPIFSSGEILHPISFNLVLYYTAKQNALHLLWPGNRYFVIKQKKVGVSSFSSFTGIQKHFAQ